MIHRDTWETWDKVFKSIADDILKLKKLSQLIRTPILLKSKVLKLLYIKGFSQC